MNDRTGMPAVSSAQQAIFDQGHEVGELAKALFPDGVEVRVSFRDIEGAIRTTTELLPLRKPIFEAAFAYDGAFARPDILIPVDDNSWDIAEVKSSTEVKDVNRHDLALQRYVYEGAGLRIRRTFIYHINHQYVRMGSVRPQELFTKADETKSVLPLLPAVPGRLRDFESNVRRTSTPDVPIGPHCSDPYPCPLRERCWAFLPKHNLTTLTRMGGKAFPLAERWGWEIKDLPDDEKRTLSQEIQIRAVRNDAAEVDREILRRFLQRLEYPLFYLDFETMQWAVPPFDATRPYQQIPFQFSLHIQPEPGGKLEHHAFLAEGTSDPRQALLEALEEHLGSRGSIVAYNASFELGRLREMTDLFREYEAWFASIEPRFADLYEPFRKFAWYHPDQRGSASMKEVLPALTGKGYEGLAIADGTAAANAYKRVTFGNVSEEERSSVRNDLLRYCGLDTEGMAWIVDALRREVEQQETGNR
jgi:hypothetical protein